MLAVSGALAGHFGQRVSSYRTKIEPPLGVKNHCDGRRSERAIV